VIQCVKKIRATDKVKSIGIISFYAAQVEVIQSKLKKLESSIKDLVTVSSVDGFQGDEKDIIIISFVRAAKSIGFLKDFRRLNVAITRSKSTLIMLGKVATLKSKDSEVKNMLANLKSRNKLFNENVLKGFLACDKLTKQENLVAGSVVGRVGNGGRKGGKGKGTGKKNKKKTIV